MPAYVVMSGDYETVANGPTPEDAASVAFGRLKNGDFAELRLGAITLVHVLDDPDTSVFISTMILVNQHNLVYRKSDPKPKPPPELTLYVHEG